MFKEKVYYTLFRDRWQSFPTLPQFSDLVFKFVSLLLVAISANFLAVNRKFLLEVQTYNRLCKLIGNAYNEKLFHKHLTDPWIQGGKHVILIIYSFKIVNEINYLPE